MKIGDTVLNTNNDYKGYVCYKSSYSNCMILMFPSNRKMLRTIDLPYVGYKIVLLEKYKKDISFI